MNHHKNVTAVREAYALACEFSQALELLGEENPELEEHTNKANELTQSLGRLWSDGE